MTAVRQTRVLVSLYPAAPYESALQVLAGFVAAEAVEIHGLFVEDLNLLKLARLPIVREFSFDIAADREITPELIERSFRAQAARMRAVFDQMVRQMAARHSFRVARGEFLAELVKAAAGFDVLVVAHSRHQFGPRLAVRAQLAQLLAAGPRTLILVQERWSTGRRVIALFDGTPESRAALVLAAAVARTEGLRLCVWLPDGGDARRDELQVEAQDILGDQSDADFSVMNLTNASAMARAAARQDARALVLPSRAAEGTRQLIIDLLDRIDCSIIATR
jgi:hypothetical protein